MDFPPAFRYPATRKGDVADLHHGVRVADPYRWLEDADSAETIAWVEAQNALTRSTLDGPLRARLKTRLAALRDHPRASAVVGRGGRYFFSRNSGLQNQDELVVQDGLAGSPRVLLDPNALSPDGTVALTETAITEDGRLMAYALSRSGSDRQEIRVRDVASGRDLPDLIRWSKFASVSWLEDGTGFYYTRFPEPGSVPPGDENYFCKVYFHRLGDEQARDRIVFERPDDKEIVFGIRITDDGRVLVITGYDGASEKSEVHLLDLRSSRGRPQLLFGGFRDAWAYIESVGSRLYFRTDCDAPRGRVVAVDLPERLEPVPEGGGGAPGIAGARALDIVPEQADKLSLAAIVNGRLVTTYLREASDELRLFGLDGVAAGRVALPALGSIPAISGRPADSEFFVDIETFTRPATPFRYDFATGQLAAFTSPRPPVDPDDYETKQVWYASKDGTRVSMFLVHRRDVTVDGERPTLLYGYGGFNVSLTPFFSPSIFVWLDAGGVFAIPNLRGGGEYGEAWHRGGMLEKKQNVFDDFIAAAEWLIANRYTRPQRLAIEGGSNGGLLVGAVEVQRPDLFGAVICEVPVADMLRYHLFTVGRFWIPEYGSADDPAQFAYLLRYSPLHNVGDGVPYPPTFVLTADTDDRVAPGMAKKFAARLQAATAGPAPVLLRVETRAGHGAGKPVGKILDEHADIYTFLFKSMGLPGR
jgi:prolyl oligopeptidase